MGRVGTVDSEVSFHEKVVGWMLIDVMLLYKWVSDASKNVVCWFAG